MHWLLPQLAYLAAENLIGFRHGLKVCWTDQGRCFSELHDARFHQHVGYELRAEEMMPTLVLHAEEAENQSQDIILVQFHFCFHFIENLAEFLIFPIADFGVEYISKKEKKT